MNRINQDVTDQALDSFSDPRFSKPPTGPLTAEDLQSAEQDTTDPWEDKRFGSRVDLGPGRVKPEETLQQMLDSVGEEAVLDAIANSKDPKEREKARLELIAIAEGRAAEAFVKANPSYYSIDENYELLKQRLIYNGAERPFTEADLQRAYDELVSEGALEDAPGTYHTLSEDELLQVAREAQSGNISNSIGLFLHFSLPSLSPAELRRAVNSADYIELCNQSVYYTFTHCTVDYVDSDSNRDFLIRFIGNRPYTLALLQEAWKSCKQYRVAAKTRVAEPTRESMEAEFNQMSDSEIASTLAEVTRERLKKRG
jgi:hypothetical protein